jgi:hypothetical protein
MHEHGSLYSPWLLNESQVSCAHAQENLINEDIKQFELILVK